MIIKRFDTCFTVEFTKEDWYFYSTYTLIELLKSIPKGYRRFDWNTKQWIVSNTYQNVIEKVQFFTEEEESEGLTAYNDFNQLFG